jgi:hypothetical protein
LHAPCPEPDVSMTKLFSGVFIGARRKTTPPAEYARIV